jgi:hypothetical protein
MRAALRSYSGMPPGHKREYPWRMDVSALNPEIQGRATKESSF